MLQPSWAPPPRITLAVFLFPQVKPERRASAIRRGEDDPKAGDIETPRQILTRARAKINRRKPARFRRP